MTLEEATRALREEGALGAGRKRAIRDRVLAAPRKRRLHAIRWVMPMAAVLAAASVWASVAHERRASVTIAPPPIATTVSAPVATVAATAIATATVTEVPREQPPVRVTPRVVVPKPVVTATTKPPVADDSERLALRAYREAERLQFDDKDYTRALDAWDRYIPLAGRSPLVVDARWQRAICLVRLDRRDEARAALEPFARGELGAYRRDEAQALLDGLR